MISVVIPALSFAIVLCKGSKHSRQHVRGYTRVQRCVVNYHIVLQAAAQEGDTAPPALEDVVDLHFVALVNKNNRLVELDGRKSFPIDHGKTSDSTILQVLSDSQHHFVECRGVCLQAYSHHAVLRK